MTHTPDPEGTAIMRALIVCGCIGAAVLLMLGYTVWDFAWSVF